MSGSASGSVNGSASGSCSGSGFGTLEYELPPKPSTLEQAVNDVVNNHVSQRRASVQWGVHRSLLQRLPASIKYGMLCVLCVVVCVLCLLFCVSSCACNTNVMPVPFALCLWSFPFPVPGSVPVCVPLFVFRNGDNVKEK